VHLLIANTLQTRIGSMCSIELTTTVSTCHRCAGLVTSMGRVLDLHVHSKPGPAHCSSPPICTVDPATAVRISSSELRPSQVTPPESRNGDPLSFSMGHTISRTTCP
jgi:hypothetical protein